jgi:two-component system CheB/CheR fusion protein
MADGKNKAKAKASLKAVSEKAAASNKKASPKEKSALPEKPVKPSIPVVGIGASAGGLEALESFFDNMPPGSGMAFVVVTHLDPTHASLMPELMQKHTKMKVLQVKDGMPVDPNHVYVIPPDRDMGIMNGLLILARTGISGGPRAPVNYFLRSLAREQKERAVAIILSGMGTDGTEGVKAIKAEFGMVMAQDPSSAKYDGMPKNAIATGLADFVLDPQKMPRYLIDYLERFITGTPVKAGPRKEIPANALQKMNLLIRDQTGQDFTAYKENTILRRIHRRMSIHQIEDIDQYVQYLQRNSQEVKSLFKELLIGVTSFFRDAEAFESLQRTALPLLFKERELDSPLRAWVPGCATGEEAYSLAIVIREFMDTLEHAHPVQIFATDIDEDAIEKARVGIYPGSVAVDVGPGRLKKFFERVDDSYTITRRIREMLVFAVQSIIKDPPFTKLDLICCRNLLIYLDSDTQKKILPLFHYSLKPGGILFLGSSETVGEFTDLFAPVDNKWKIYKSKETVLALRPHLAFPLTPATRPSGGHVKSGQRSELPALVETHLMEHHTPPAVVIDKKGDIAYIHGRTGKYLEPQTGPTRPANAIDMARDPLKAQIPILLRAASSENKAVSRIVKISSNGGEVPIRLTVKPVFQQDLKGLYMVLFDELPLEKKKEKPGDKKGQKKDDALRYQHLEDELRSTRESLQTTIEELETSNEELRSINEEYQSANEELQSANEELNSSKEEMQSLNEELETVNAELQGKNQELVYVNDDLKNLLDSLAIPTIFLDNQLRIKRYTSDVSKVINLRETDIGRPLGDLSLRIKYNDLIKDASEVLQTLSYKEVEAESIDGHWYSVRIRPYRTVGNMIDGLVIVFVDVHKEKVAEAALEGSEILRRFTENIVNTVREPLVVMNQDLQIAFANEAFYNAFRLRPEDAMGEFLYKLNGNAWDIPALRTLLEQILPEQSSFQDFAMECEFPGLGVKRLRLSGRRMHQKELGFNKMLLAVEDVTEKTSDQ